MGNETCWKVTCESMYGWEEGVYFRSYRKAVEVAAELKARVHRESHACGYGNRYHSPRVEEVFVRSGIVFEDE